MKENVFISNNNKKYGWTDFILGDSNLIKMKKDDELCKIYGERNDQRINGLMGLFLLNVFNENKIMRDMVYQFYMNHAGFFKSNFDLKNECFNKTIFTKEYNSFGDIIICIKEWQWQNNINYQICNEIIDLIVKYKNKNCMQ